MPKTKNRTSRITINRPLAWLIAAIIVVAAIVAYYLGSPAPNTSTSSGSSATSKPRGSTEDIAQGGAVDNKGSGVAKTPATEWASSESGLITLRSPLSGSLVKTGDTISGTAKVSTVQYRLVDDEAGVLAQGPLSVVDGKFSGRLSFGHQANSGKLDIFSYDSNGAETNSISIKIKLGS